MKEVLDWDNNPREMWVWDDDVEDKKRMKVVCIYMGNVIYPVIALTTDGQSRTYKHCAEVGKIMTYQELSWWLMDGIREGKHREWRFDGDTINPTIHSYLGYSNKESNMPVENILIRENGGEWLEPLVEYEE